MQLPLPTILDFKSAYQTYLYSPTLHYFRILCNTMPFFGRRNQTPEPHHQYDGQQSVLIVKAAAKHIVESIANQTGQYIQDRVVPAHEAHPNLTFALEICIAACFLRLYRRTIGKLLVVAFLLAAFHAWVDGLS